MLPSGLPAEVFLTLTNVAAALLLLQSASPEGTNRPRRPKTQRLDFHKYQQIRHDEGILGISNAKQIQYSVRSM